MLFLVGTRDANVKNGEILNEKCPNCSETNSLHFSVYRRYAHLTLIPLFPVGKLVFIKCNHCKESFNYEDLPESIQLKLRTEKTSNSIWMFTGSFILTLLLIFTIKEYFHKKDETSMLIKTPIVGDVYNLKFSDGYYSNMKIDKVTKDSIYTTHNDFNAYLPYEIDALDKSENYTNRKVTYSKKELLELYKKDEIIEIKRSKYPIQLQKSEYQIPITK